MNGFRKYLGSKISKVGDGVDKGDEVQQFHLLWVNQIVLKQETCNEKQQTWLHYLN